MVMNSIFDTVQYLLPAAVFMILYLLILGMRFHGKERKASKLWYCAMVLLGLYFTVVFAATISPVYGTSYGLRYAHVNVIPGQVLSTIAINPRNFFGNILMFMPLGFLLPMVSNQKQRVAPVVFSGFLCSLSIELMQLFLGRGTDIDDVILNTFGGFLGFLIFVMVSKWIPGLYLSTGVYDVAQGHPVRMTRDYKYIIPLVLAMLVLVWSVGTMQRQQYMNNTTTNQEQSVISQNIDKGEAAQRIQQKMQWAILNGDDAKLQQLYRKGMKLDTI